MYVVMRLRKETKKSKETTSVLIYYLFIAFFFTATFDKYLIVLNMPEQERNSILPFNVVIKISLI